MSTSTNIFYGQSATITVHMPSGSPEAVLLIEALDETASVTLPLEEVRRLAEMLQAHANSVEGRSEKVIDEDATWPPG